MNPVLLWANSDTGSQVIVLGKPVGNMDFWSTPATGRPLRRCAGSLRFARRRIRDCLEGAPPARSI